MIPARIALTSALAISDGVNAPSAWYQRADQLRPRRFDMLDSGQRAHLMPLLSLSSRSCHVPRRVSRTDRHRRRSACSVQYPPCIVTWTRLTLPLHHRKVSAARRGGGGVVAPPFDRACCCDPQRSCECFKLVFRPDDSVLTVETGTRTILVAVMTITWSSRTLSTTPIRRPSASRITWPVFTETAAVVG